MPAVVDVHVHLVALDRSQGVIVGRRIRRHPLFKALMLQYGYPFADEKTADANYIKRLADQVRRSAATDRVVLLALDGIYDDNGKLDPVRTQEYIPNEYCRKICGEHEEFLFGASINPDRADALDELEKVKGQGAALVKWLPSSQDFDPSNPRYIPFYRKIAELDLPLLSHTGYEHCVPVTDQMYGDPKRLRQALDQGVTVIAAHCGTSGIRHPVEFFDDYLAMLDEYPNLYGDLAAITGISRFTYIPRMLESPGFMDRHIQATDYPSPPMPWLFWRRLGIRETIRLGRIRNIFDRDVELKRALGFPDTVFTKAAEILKV